MPCSVNKAIGTAVRSKNDSLQRIFQWRSPTICEFHAILPITVDKGLSRFILFHSKGKLTCIVTRIKVVGYSWDRLDEPVIMARPKPLLTEFLQSARTEWKAMVPSRQIFFQVYRKLSFYWSYMCSINSQDQHQHWDVEGRRRRDVSERGGGHQPVAADQTGFQKMPGTFVFRLTAKQRPRSPGNTQVWTHT